MVVITTSSVDAAHGEFEIVHRKTAVPGTTKPVTVDDGELGLLTVAVPETTSHEPVPVVGLFPDKDVAITLQPMF